MGLFVRSAALAFATFALCLTPALAAPPADCSKGPIPAGPAKGMLAGTPFTVTQASMQSLSEAQTDANGVKLDTYYVTLSQDLPDNTTRELKISAAVVRGTRPDGKTLRMLPGENATQPEVAPHSGAPEIQFWSISDDAHNVNLDPINDKDASLQFAFGKRKGNIQPASLYFCTPSAKKSWIGGSFSFEVEK